MSRALENMSFEELLEITKKMESENEDLVKTNQKMEARLNDMQFQLDQMKRLIFGFKRERFIKNTDENQLTLPFDVPPETEVEKQQETITYTRTKTKRKNHPGRM